MLKKTSMMALILIYGVALVTPACTAEQQKRPIARSQEKEVEARPANPQQEITIRNVTKETVYYSIKPTRGNEAPMKRSLEVGKIHRYPGTETMEVEFLQKGEPISYTLDPGMPYAFRYDENDLLELYEGSHGRSDVEDLAPYVPSPPSVVEKMLDMAGVTKDDVVYDLGCGDGRIVVMAARKYGARGIGIDLDPERIAEAHANARAAEVEKLVEFYVQDVTASDFSEATVVTLYLLTESNELLRPYLEKQLRSGTRVVSHNYRVPGWEKKEIEEASVEGEDGEMHNIYLYRR